MFQLPTLELVVDLVSLLNEQTSEQITVTETTKKIVQREQKLQKELAFIDSILFSQAYTNGHR